MHNHQWIASLVIENVLKGHNLDKSFNLVFKIKDEDIKNSNISNIKDLTYGALRFLGNSSFIINKLIMHKITNKSLESLLHVALFQINHARSNNFTIVDQAVMASKKIDSKKSSFVNAILRNYLRKRKNIEKQIINNEEAKFSYPSWWIKKIKKEYSNDWENILNTGNEHPPLSIRLNLQKNNLNDYKEILIKKKIKHTALMNEGLIIDNPIDVRNIPGFMSGDISVQDYGAQLAAHILDLKKNYLVLDACSAPGGKACHMLELEKIKLTAVELDKNRMKKINENLDRMGQSAKVINAKISSNNTWWDKKLFDRILVDAPCSASGIVRRHVDIKWLRRPQDLEFFSKQQLDLLVNSWKMLKVNGKLLYVTCSIFNEENRQVIDKFKSNISGVRELEIMYPDNIKVINNQLIPTNNHDGLFYALLEKK